VGIGRYYILILLFLPILISISPNDVFAEVTDQDKKPMEPKEEEQIKQEDLAKIEETTDPNKENIIILYKEKVAEKNIQNLKKMDAEIKSVFNIIPGIAATIDQMYMEDLMVYDEDVENIYKDSLVHSTLFGSVPQINADKVHQKGFTGQGVKVCIVDTGVDDSHPALAKLFKEKDFVNDDDDATDDNSHGTHVAGIVASRDSIHKGVAFDSSLMAAKVLNQFGSGSVSAVISGIDWCVSEEADIISMSLGGGLFSGNCDSGDSALNVLARASNNAVDEGVTVVAASGNEGQLNRIISPACASKVIAVGAVNKNDGRTSFSNEGTELDVVAPGVSIRSLGLGGSISIKSGTSMATPHVSGLIALLLEKNPALNPSEIRDIVRNTALDLGIFGFDTIYGFGRIDSLNAIESVNVSITAREQKEQLLTAIQDTIDEPSSDKNTIKKLEKAKERIQKSLDPKLWEDDDTLTSKHGNKVFNEEKKAVKSLMKILKKGDSGIDTEISDVIALLVDVDRMLARDAITEAESFAGDKKVDKEIKKANKEMDKAQKQLDKNKPDKAIDKFKKAWKHAQKAIKHATK